MGGVVGVELVADGFGLAQVVDDGLGIVGGVEEDELHGVGADIERVVCEDVLHDGEVIVPCGGAVQIGEGDAEYGEACDGGLPGLELREALSEVVKGECEGECDPGEAGVDAVFDDDFLVHKSESDEQVKGDESGEGGELGTADY